MHDPGFDYCNAGFYFNGKQLTGKTMAVEIDVTEIDAKIGYAAEVGALEEHLTVPSRSGPGLVDLWFLFRGPRKLEAWESEFHLLASLKNWNAGVADVQLSLITPGRGWLVVRGVNRRQMSDASVEALIKKLVERTNRACAVRPTERPSEMRADAQPLSTRWRRALIEFSASVASRRPRPQGMID